MIQLGQGNYIPMHWNLYLKVGSLILNEVYHKLKTFPFFNAATEPKLRDNASLRQVALAPRVRYMPSPEYAVGQYTLAILIVVLCSMLQDQVEMLLPIAIGDYTDFFSSMHHAKNCGTIFRGPENPIPANWYADIVVQCLYTLFSGNCGKQRK